MSDPRTRVGRRTSRHRFAALAFALLLSCVLARGVDAQQADVAPPAVAPPAEAYLAVLRHVAELLRRESPGERIAVFARSLPASVPDERLRELDMVRADDLCVATRVVVFEPAEPREPDTPDTFTLQVIAGKTNNFLMPSVFSVRCADGECHARRVPGGPISDSVVGCASTAGAPNP